MASHFHCYCLEDSYDVLLNFGGPQGIEPIEEVLGNFYKMLKRLCEPGFYLEFCALGSECVSPFHLFHLFIDWSELVGSLWLLVCWGCLFGAFLLPLYVADQSLRSSCLPMTTLAQLHDCHSCNDERSIVQKKIPPFIQLSPLPLAQLAKRWALGSFGAGLEAGSAGSS